MTQCVVLDGNLLDEAILDEEIVGNMFLVSYYIELVVLDGNSLAKDAANDCMKNLRNPSAVLYKQIDFFHIEQCIRGFVIAKSHMYVDKYVPNHVCPFVLQNYNTKGHYHVFWHIVLSAVWFI